MDDIENGDDLTPAGQGQDLVDVSDVPAHRQRLSANDRDALEQRILDEIERLRAASSDWSSTPAEPPAIPGGGHYANPDKTPRIPRDEQGALLRALASAGVHGAGDRRPGACRRAESRQGSHGQEGRRPGHARGTGRPPGGPRA